ncbi:MAG: hypothetical protein ABIM89_17430 [Mycobacteriales bacterium]
MTKLYAPTRSEIFEAARHAPLAKTHKYAKGWLLEKLSEPPDDWQARTVFTTPGIVWAVESFDGMASSSNAPRNVAYDDHRREFVYRQPESAEEMIGIMSADSQEPLLATASTDWSDALSPHSGLVHHPRRGCRMDKPHADLRGGT